MPDVAPNDTMRTLHTLTRITAPFSAQVKLTRVEWESVYCPAVEFGPFQDCKQASGNVHMDERDLEEIKRKGRVSRPGTCFKGVCDGSSEVSCLSPSIFYLDTLPFAYSPELSSSWLHHRCSRRVESVTIEVDSIVTNVGTNLTSIEVPGVGHCSFNPQAMGCIIEDRWVALIDRSWRRSVQTTQFPCIEKGEERVCYDKETKSQFYMGPDACNVVPGATYCRVDMDNSGVEETDRVRVVTPETMFEMSLQLEYENLENAFDHQVIMNKFRKVNNLVSSLLLYVLNVSPDPLQHYLGFGLTNVTRRGDLIAGAVCHMSYVNDPHFPVSQEGTTNLSLFKNDRMFGGYEEMKSKIPFIKRPDLTGHSHFNSTKLKHGEADIISVASLSDFLLPDWCKVLPGVIMHILPVVNSIFLILFFSKRI